MMHDHITFFYTYKLPTNDNCFAICIYNFDEINKTPMHVFFSLFFDPYNRIKIELHFSLIAAAVTYIMWKNVGNDKIQKVEGKRFLDDGFHSDGSGSRGTLDPKKRRSGYWRVDCQSASKGLFLGLLCLVGGIIILIIFFVMKVNTSK